MQHPDNYPNSRLGATRQNLRRPALRPFLKEMMDAIENPHAYEDRKRVRAQFLQFMYSSAGEPFRETVFLYWFDLNYRSLLADYPDPNGHLPTRAELKKKAQETIEKKAVALRQRMTTVIEEKAEEKAQLILLDWILPNGKPLRDCTGRECRQMSGRVGGWLRKISDRIKPTDLVGKVMQEADVRKLYGKD